MHYVMIDFENVQPKALDRLKSGGMRIKVFLGQHQSKLQLDLVQALLPYGKDAELIQIAGSGPDAVDFHIALYIGRISMVEPSARFTIISKDRGFDPLVKHLASLDVQCVRYAEIPPVSAEAATPGPKPAVQKPAATIPVVAKSAAAKSAATAVQKKAATAALATPSGKAVPTTTRARAKAILEQLKKSTKPATLATLRSAINAHFMKKLDGKALDAIVQSLTSSKKIVINGTRVSYNLG